MVEEEEQRMWLIESSMVLMLLLLLLAPLMVVEGYTCLRRWKVCREQVEDEVREESNPEHRRIQGDEGTMSRSKRKKGSWRQQHQPDWAWIR